MEINQKTQLTTVKNEHYQGLLSTLDNAIQNWHNFSRLDRLEYAYRCLELSRNYTCATRGVDPAKISVGLEIMPYMGYTHAVKTADAQTLVTTTLSVPQLLSAFKVSPESIMVAALHESTHACDDILEIKDPHYENSSDGTFKLGTEFLPPEYHKEISQNYNNFGIAWLGMPGEIRANEVGYGVTLDLLKDFASLHPEDNMYQLRAEAFENKTIEKLERQYAAETELEQWKTELYQKYLPEGQTSYPIINESISIEFEEPTHNFVTIDEARAVAQQNEELFTTPGYVASELHGFTTNKEVDAHPEIGEQFKQTNATCVQQIGETITPETTMDFCCPTEAMEMN